MASTQAGQVPSTIQVITGHKTSASDGSQRGPQCHHREQQGGRHGEQAEPGELGRVDLGVVPRTIRRRSNVPREPA